MTEKKQNQSGNGRANGKSVTDDLFEMLNPNKMLNNAQKVMSSAVQVLEEEIAAGILAAKRIEKKVINEKDIHSNPEDLMNRIRRDTHEALDIFLDAFAALSKQMGILTDTITKKKEDAAPETATADRSSPIQVIQPDAPVKAGQKVSIPFTLSDEAIKEPVKINLHKTTFTGPTGQKIPERYVLLKPALITLKPGEEKKVLLQITIPRNSKKGWYHSLLTTSQFPDMKTIASFEIK